MATVPHQSVKPISVGPWGGQGGDKWDDGVYSGIHQIIVVYGDAIDSIHIEYDNNGNPLWLEHGGHSGSKIEKIQLDYPKEILTSISGHYDTYLRSLTFKSNLKKYGPYGREQGTHFSFPNSDGKRIVGFHGQSGSYLDCIGVYLSNFHIAVPPKSVKPISVGPWGGKGGNKWDDGVYSGIHQMIVVYGDAVHSIHIEYDNNGSTVWKEHGGSARGKIEKIQLDYPKEILTSISGRYDTYLRSLTFKSNLKKYGPYGRQQGTYFSFPISDGKIVGFHGRSGLYLDCIGVYLTNLHTAVPPKSLKPISLGPWGGQGGVKWDDGVYLGIHRIIVVYGDAINSIKIKYDNNGSPLRLEHGGSGGNKIEKIELEYPKEILTSISGHYDTYLRSLTFKSNLKKYGPYGSEKGTYFSFPNSDGKIVGFHGQSGLYLDSIGVYLSNFHTAVPPKEYPPEGEHAGIGGEPSFNRRFERGYRLKGEDAIIVGGSSTGSAKKAKELGEKEAEAKKKEGSRAREEEDTRAFERESPREGEHACIGGELIVKRLIEEEEYRLEGEDAIIVRGSSFGSAKAAQEAERKKKEKEAERKKKEGSRAREEEDTRAFERESPREGEHACIGGELIVKRRIEEEEYRLEGEDAIIVRGSSFGSAKAAQEAERKKKEKEAERKKKEGSRAREEEEGGKEEKEAEGAARYLSSLHI